MTRTRLNVLLAFAMHTAVPAAADPFQMTSAFSVEEPNERVPREQEPDALLKGRIEGAGGGFYGGLNGRTLPDPDQVAALDVFVGLRPHFGRVAVDLGYTRQVSDVGAGKVALRLDREVGAHARLGARLQVDPEAEIGMAEANATLDFDEARIAGTLGHRFDITSGTDSHVMVDFAASRPLGTGASMDLRYRDAISTSGRTELLVRLRF